MTILVTGADGMLGSAVVRAAEEGAIPVVGFSKEALDITDGGQVGDALGRYPGAIVINCAGIVRGRTDVDRSRMALVNSGGPHLLAIHAGRLLQVSTDSVFDGTITEGVYLEDSPPCPADYYGQSKLFGEVLGAPHLTVRVSFVGLGQRGLLHWLLSHPKGAEVLGFTNWLWNGWAVPSLANILLDLALAPPAVTGLIHLPGPDVVTKAWLLKEVARRVRPDLTIMEVEAPVGHRMVLMSQKLEQLELYHTWTQMLDRLEAQYREAL